MVIYGNKKNQTLKVYIMLYTQYIVDDHNSGY